MDELLLGQGDRLVGGAEPIERQRAQRSPRHPRRVDVAADRLAVLARPFERVVEPPLGEQQLDVGAQPEVAGVIQVVATVRPRAQRTPRAVHVAPLQPRERDLRAEIGAVDRQRPPQLQLAAADRDQLLRLRQLAAAQLRDARPEVDAGDREQRAGAVRVGQQPIPVAERLVAVRHEEDPDRGDGQEAVVGGDDRVVGERLACERDALLPPRRRSAPTPTRSARRASSPPALGRTTARGTRAGARPSPARRRRTSSCRARSPRSPRARRPPAAPPPLRRRSPASRGAPVKISDCASTGAAAAWTAASSRAASASRRWTTASGPLVSASAIPSSSSSCGRSFAGAGSSSARRR